MSRNYNKSEIKQTNGQQTQVQYQSDKQEQAQIQYYIYQDLQNITNLIHSRKAVLEHFGNDLSHPMVILSNNKILLQLNLSCGIHKDQQEYYQKSKTLTNLLDSERKKAYQLLKQVIENNGNQMDQGVRNSDPLQQSLQKYKKDYENSKFGINEYTYLPTNQDSNFDENVLSKVISSIQNVDYDLTQIKDYYPVPDMYKIQSKANEYQYSTKQKLSINFPKNGKTYNYNGKYDNKFGIEEEKHINGNDNNRRQNLINFLILQGYFNEETIQYNCYNLVQDLFNEIKDQLITSLEQYKVIGFAKQLHKENNLKNQVKLYFFFSLFMEYEKQCSNIMENQKIQVFNRSIKTISSKTNSDINGFFNYLDMVNISPLYKNQDLQNVELIDNLFQIFQKNQEKKC